MLIVIIYFFFHFFLYGLYLTSFLLLHCFHLFFYIFILVADGEIKRRETKKTKKERDRQKKER